MDTSTLFLLLAIVMLACCVGPMLLMRKRRGSAHGDGNSQRPQKPKAKSDA